MVVFMLFGQPFGGVIPGVRGAVLAVLLRTGEPLTGRQVHGLLRDEHSLWAVQEGLRAWARLGVLHTVTVGRAVLHSVNEVHVAVPALRSLLDPVAALTAALGEHLDPQVQAVILYGSVARGEATAESDVDLAVIASAGVGPAGGAGGDGPVPAGQRVRRPGVHRGPVPSVGGVGRACCGRHPC